MNDRTGLAAHSLSGIKGPIHANILNDKKPCAHHLTVTLYQAWIIQLIWSDLTHVAPTLALSNGEGVSSSTLPLSPNVEAYALRQMTDSFSFARHFAGCTLSRSSQGSGNATESKVNHSRWLDGVIVGGSRGDGGSTSDDKRAYGLKPIAAYVKKSAPPVTLSNIGCQSTHFTLPIAKDEDAMNGGTNKVLGM